MTARPLVMIDWEDAKLIDSEATWVDADAETKYEALVVRTVGFVLSDTPEGVILTHSLSPVVMAPRDQIPRGMIRKITPLKPTKTR